MLLVRLLCFFLLTSSFTTTNQVSLKLTSTAGMKGSIRLAIFDSKGALTAEIPFWGEVIILEGDDFPLYKQLDQLPQGEIAIGVYHDLNNNGTLDRNFFGVPTEPYAFSGKPASKWRAPRWEEVAIDPSAEKLELDLKMMFWKEQ